MHQRRLLVLGVGIFVLLALSLQIFLLMVGLEAWLTYDAAIAWGTAVTSVLLAAFALTLYRFLARGPRTSSSATSRPPRTSTPTHPTVRPTRVGPAERR
jgi:membrane protein implicated in regulation of membrane protease activity